jgi:predicted metal-dependent phosphoesterase TrpH
MIKVDLHTHSVASPDGSLRAAHYRRVLEAGKLDVIAVTDHDSIAFAQQLQAELGDRIIVGEEISALEGEIVGLYLRALIPSGLSANETINCIKEQGGLVYIPHPFETLRKGLPRRALDAIAEQVDIVETYNGRAIFQNRSAAALVWAKEHTKAQAASSDAHGWHGWGGTYSSINKLPARETLPKLLADAQLVTSNVGARGVLYPKLNRLRRKLRKGQTK